MHKHTRTAHTHAHTYGKMHRHFLCGSIRWNFFKSQRHFCTWLSLLLINIIPEICMRVRDASRRFRAQVTWLIWKYHRYFTIYMSLVLIRHYGALLLAIWLPLPHSYRTFKYLPRIIITIGKRKKICILGIRGILVHLFHLIFATLSGRYASLDIFRMRTDKITYVC